MRVGWRRAVAADRIGRRTARAGCICRVFHIGRFCRTGGIRADSRICLRRACTERSRHCHGGGKDGQRDWYCRCIKIYTPVRLPVRRKESQTIATARPITIDTMRIIIRTAEKIRLNFPDRKFIMKYTFRPGQSAGAISKIIKGYGLKSKKTPARSVLSFFPPQAQLFLYRQYSIFIVLNFPEENAILES